MLHNILHFQYLYRGNSLYDSCLYNFIQYKNTTIILACASSTVFAGWRIISSGISDFKKNMRRETGFNIIAGSGGTNKKMKPRCGKVTYDLAGYGIHIYIYNIYQQNLQIKNFIYILKLSFYCFTYPP